MHKQFTCVRGHRWQVDLQDSSPAGMDCIACPECGSTAQTFLAAEMQTFSHAGSPLRQAETLLNTPAVPAASKLPRTIGRFEVLSLLGEGGFGAVYRARDPQLERDVAIKVPREGLIRSPEDRERLLREARAAATLNHANICPVFEAGEEGGLLYLVMGYVPGKTLAALIEKGKPISNPQAASAVRKLAQALDEAHRHGVVHRDLKPANIMINQRGEPVIMDFGLAQRRLPGDVPLTVSGMLMGTPAYMPPEQARGDSKLVGPAADIYSLGIVLYELLAGRRPFEGSFAEVLGQILHVQPQPPSHFKPAVDGPLESICLKAIAKDPGERFASMAEFASALSEYLHNRNLPPPPPLPGHGSGAGASEVPRQAEFTISLTREALLTAPAPIIARTHLSRKRQHREPLIWMGVAGGAIVLCVAMAMLLRDSPAEKVEKEESGLAAAMATSLVEGAGAAPSSPGIAKTAAPADPANSNNDPDLQWYAANRGVEIPADAATFNGHSYKFFEEQLAWKEASSKCESLGGYLVVIDSAEENRFVAGLIASRAWQDAWIGLTDEAKEGEWRTVQRRLAAYFNWYPNQPNNKAGGEHYALISNRDFSSTGRSMGWTWCDQPNRSEQHQPGYVCEWDR